MKISIISASHRMNSQSKKICDLLKNDLLILNPDIQTFSLDLAESSLPLWSPEKKNGVGVWGKTWNTISKNLDSSDGFILVVPEYGGIGSINCALQDEAFDQFACFHRVTDKIDDGEVVDRESFTLSPDKPYYVNEDIAYAAATCLLLRNVELKN